LLTYLKVSDLALVERLEVDFHRGLNVLSGETGAGKTVLVGAIGLLLGDRAEAQMVRTGAAEAVLEAAFDVSSAPAVREALVRLGFVSGDEDEIVLGRKLPREGKSRCTVNGRLCPVSALAEIGALLLEVHGQNAHQALLKQSTHVSYLDRYAGAEHLSRLEEYSDAYSRLRALLTEREEALSAPDGAREAELLSHEIAQIDSADPNPGELEEADALATRLRFSKELWELASSARDVLSADSETSASVRGLASRATADIEKMASRDDVMRPLAARAESLSLESEDLASELGRYIDSLDTDPARLEQVESRLSLLRDLCRKYGGSLESVLAYRDRASERLAEIEGFAERAAVLYARIGEAREEVSGLASVLSKDRARAARALEKEMVEQLAGLELSSAGFGVLVEERVAEDALSHTGQFGPAGGDEVEFMFSPEPAEPLRPLRRIASGGEMSRVMLALKIVLAGADRLPVLVFDEVDAGIGGETATTVGEKLYQLTGYHQVFCVTHLPQIASFADWQYGVFKSVDDGRSRTGIALLEGEDRVTEMCRMLGDASGRRVTAQHARDILKRAQARKNSLESDGRLSG
jgi:DNA repair protein RecN (Recombination protein N)